jgi:hypothetical protein
VGVWRINADLLAKSALGLSEMVETLGALRLLAYSPPQPWQREWRDRHRPAFRELLAERPVTRAVLEHSYAPTWIAGYFTRAPRRLGLPFETELDAIRRYTDEHVRQDMYDTSGPRLPRILTRSGPQDRVLVDAIVEIVEWVWTRDGRAGVAPAAQGAAGRRGLPDRAAGDRRLVGGDRRHAAGDALARR